MLGVAITIDVDAAPLRGGFAALRAAALDLHPALDAIGRRWADRTRARFTTGIGPDGVEWKPSQRAIRDDGQTLRDSGDLMNSITHEVEGDSVSVGTNKIYGPAHQFGVTILPKKGEFLRFFIPGRGWVFARKVTLPPRPFIGLDAGDAEEFAEILADHLKGSSGSTGAAT